MAIFPTCHCEPLGVAISLSNTALFQSQIAALRFRSVRNDVIPNLQCQFQSGNNAAISAVHAVAVTGDPTAADVPHETVAIAIRGTQPPHAVTVVRRTRTVIPIATLALGVIARLFISFGARFCAAARHNWSPYPATSLFLPASPTDHRFLYGHKR